MQQNYFPDVFQFMPVKVFLTSFMILFSSFAFAQDGNESTEADAEHWEEKVWRNLNEALESPDDVYILDLRSKRLDSIPPGVFQFTNLRELILSRNKLESVPPEIARLQNLERLDLASNRISALPDEIGSLANLRFLGLNRNVIVSLPATIGKLSKLEVLELWDNELEDLPDEISQLKNLKVLELRGILFSEEQQAHFDNIVVPSARIYMSPGCNCK